MNRIRSSQWLYVGLIVILTACQLAKQAPESKILKPEDVIDGMSLTTGMKDAAPLWAFCSQPEHTRNSTSYNCRVPLIPRLAIGLFLLPGDDSLTMLDWYKINWELTIDEHPIDLNSFGIYDFALPVISQSPSPVREVFMQSIAWDVVLTNLNPGEHTLQVLAQTGSDSYTWVIHLTIEGNDLGQGILWVGSDIQVTF